MGLKTANIHMRLITSYAVHHIFICKNCNDNAENSFEIKFEKLFSNVLEIPNLSGYSFTIPYILTYNYWHSQKYEIIV